MTRSPTAHHWSFSSVPLWPVRWGVTLCSPPEVLKLSRGMDEQLKKALKRQTFVPGSPHLARTLPVPFSFTVNKPPNNPPPIPNPVRRLISSQGEKKYIFIITKMRSVAILAQWVKEQGTIPQCLSEESELCPFL